MGLPRWAKVTMAAFLLMAICRFPAQSQETFLRVFPGVELDSTETLRTGRRLFNLHFLPAAAGHGESTETGTGLGPLFNRNACSGCHPKGGRGAAPNGPEEPLLTALVRLSDAKGGTHSGYGGQLNTRGIRGVPAEAEVSVSYETVKGRFGDGEQYDLRRPVLSFSQSSYGPLDTVLTSFRIAQPIFGLGLLDAVPVEDMEIFADPDDRDGDGISGRLNTVWDAEKQSYVPGRFGWKANEPTLKQQIAGAFLGDMGITTYLFPSHDCGQGQPTCRSADSPDPELNAEDLSSIEAYLSVLAPPARRVLKTEDERRGEQIFHDVGCAKCHRPTFAAIRAEGTVLNGIRPMPYSDLLLHDMGEALADHRPDFDAGGSEWRTPPLWGLGSIVQVHGKSALLHDGRAQSVAEAILWHGGEATEAREGFRTLAKADRLALIAFLNSL